MSRGGLTRGQRTRDHRVKDGRFSTRDASAAPAGFNPLSLTWDRYYDYSDAASVTLNVAAISQINDQSANLAHATQGTGANQPTYSLAAQNGLNVGTFDGSTDRLVTGANFTITQPYQLYVVAKFTGAAAGAQANYVTVTGHQLTKAVTTDRYSISAGTVLSPATVVDNSWHVIVCYFSGVSSYIMLDGVSIAAGNAGTQGVTNSTISMGATSAGAQPFAGQIGHVSYGVQTNTDRDAMVTHLMSKWGI